MKTPKQIKRWLYQARLRACVWEYPLEKFAQLVVKECVSILNNRFMNDLNREDMKVRRCVVDIKQHFGMNNEQTNP